MNLLKLNIVILLTSLVALFSCAPSLSLNESQLKVVWREYHKREFEESFYQKLSSSERKELMKKTAEHLQLDYMELMVILKEQYPDKYTELFLD